MGRVRPRRTHTFDDLITLLSPCYSLRQMNELGTHIESTLREKLGATVVEVVDETHLHKGHAGARGGAMHFKVRVVSPVFAGKSLVQRHRMVNALFAEELKHAIHALALDTRAPGE